MPVTGTGLADEFWDGTDDGATSKIKWWITSVAPFYCGAASATPNFGTGDDDTWCGVSIAPSSTVPTKYTTGVQIAHTTPDGEPAGPGIIYIDGTGNQQTWLALNKSNGPYAGNSTKEALRPGSYQITKLRTPLHFGPYELDLTDENGNQLPETDGDAIFILTGSDLINPEDERGTSLSYDANDMRMFNLLFYSTGSDRIDELSARIPGNDPATVLSDYGENTRETFVATQKNMVFCAMSQSSNPNNLMWWPITFDQANGTNILVQRNDS